MKQNVKMDFFCVEQKRQRRERFIQLVLMMLLGMVVVSFGQVDSLDLKLTKSVKSVYPYIKTGVSIVLFIFFLAKAIPAVMGNNKETNWWELLGIIAAIAVLQVAPALYDAIAGTKISQ